MRKVSFDEKECGKSTPDWENRGRPTSLIGAVVAAVTRLVVKEEGAKRRRKTEYILKKTVATANKANVSVRYSGVIYALQCHSLFHLRQVHGLD